MDVLAGGLGWLLQSLFQFTNSYGVSIILATIIVRLLLYPLTLSQTKNMIAIKKMQPEMDALQKKYKDNKEELNKRVMELYQKNKINPFGGCLPLLIQLPILWAFFRVLRELPFGDEGKFLIWMLSETDKYFILPILAAATTYLQSRMTITDTQQKTMLIMMPLMIGFFSVSLPSGLVLYWITSNLFSIAQQAYINKMYPVQ
ncbi:MAG: YidC/Oxa1 family membrane protein insertase [Bacteroidales bacterium]|nr:YidC/Oxa1 family membrane protein insertase [Bacteroidales bacterium]HHY15579.1 YidC/Oxa1 family membrane protein insertase [Bacillota bacterium]